MRRRLVLFFSVPALAGVLGSGVAHGGTTKCVPLSVAAGSSLHGVSPGARCLLRAFQRQCRPAVYDLTVFGIDTVAVNEFRVASQHGVCYVDLQRFFQVLPQVSRLTGHGRCQALRARGKDIVATRCKGTAFPATISLTRGPAA